MNRDSVNWFGAMPAITTPFDDDGKIDERELGDVIERHLSLGVTGVVVGGCTGEFWAMTAGERARLFAVARAAIGTRGTLIAGTGRDGLVAVASHPNVDLVLCASSGTDALEAVLAAIEHGKTIALANKEVMVMAGGIVTEAATRSRSSTGSNAARFFSTTSR